MSKTPREPAVLVRIAVEAVVLTIVNGQLNVALHRRRKAPFAGQWALPRGRIRPERDRDPRAAIDRVLSQQLASSIPFLSSLTTVGGADRDPRGWSLSMVFFGLASVEPAPAAVLGGAEWRPVTQVSALAFDHGGLVQQAVQRLRQSLFDVPFGTDGVAGLIMRALLPEVFTLSQLQTAYQQVLDQPLDKRGFRRHIESLGLLEPVAGQFTGGVQRPAQRYRLRSAVASSTLTDAAAA